MNIVVPCVICFETKPVFVWCTEPRCNKGICIQCADNYMTHYPLCPYCRRNTLNILYRRQDAENVDEAIVDINTITYEQEHFN